MERAADGEEVSPEGLLSALESVRGLRDELADWEPRLIGAARRFGVSWADLAPALGVASRQAAERRYLRMRQPEHDTGELNADARVQAERDRRAGERAVRTWARDNSELVRKLAAMVSATQDEIADERTRYRVDVVYRTLGADDPTLLLSPLASAAEDLHRSHPDLAEQLEDLNSRVYEVRRDAEARRVGG